MASVNDGPCTSSASVCRICTEKVAQYTCPRCHLAYCSLPCYRSPVHLQCSEGFYRECCQEALREMTVSPETRHAMLDVLKRQREHLDDEDSDSDEEENGDDNELENDLAQRLLGLDLDKEEDVDAIWECLTRAEQREFETLLESNDISAFIAPWEPWWTSKSNHPVAGIEEVMSAVESSVSTLSSDRDGLSKSEPVESCLDNVNKKVRFESVDSSQVGEQADAYHVQESSAPKLLQSKIRPLAELMGSADRLPSPLVRYTLVNVLLAYCYICRYFNGDWYSLWSEAVSCFLVITNGLTKDKPPDSVSEAMGRLVTSLSTQSQDSAKKRNSNYPFSQEICVTLLRDTLQILASNSSSLALSDCLTLLSTKPKTGGRKFESNDVKRLRLGIKKLEFLLSWSCDSVESGGLGAADNDNVQLLMVHLELEICSRSTELAASTHYGQTLRDQTKKNLSGSHRLIEEL